MAVNVCGVWVGIVCPSPKTLDNDFICVGGDPLGSMSHVTSPGSATGPALSLPKGALASSIGPGTHGLRALIDEEG